MHHRWTPWLLVPVLALAACGGGSQSPEPTPAPSAAPAPTPTPTPTVTDTGPETSKVAPLGRGINLGNMLEAPSEGAWGTSVQQSYFTLIKAKGYDTVRIPIRWAAHADQAAPYTIDATFMARIDQVVTWGLSENLNIIVNCHNWIPEDGLFTDPDGQKDRFIAIWQQIATHFKDFSPKLYLEPLNEPHGNLQGAKWNSLLASTVNAIRAIDTTHTFIVDPDSWGGPWGLDNLVLPMGEAKVIASFHYYEPFTFTHQGADWVSPVPPLGITWPGADPASAMKAVRDHMAKVATWQQNHNNVPVFMGEFGAYSKGDLISRANWTAYVRKQAETSGFSWAYWEFNSGFGAYDNASGNWNLPLTTAMGLQ